MRTMLGVALLAVVSGCAYMPGHSERARIDMNAQNQSGENGKATLTAMGDQTKVEIDLKNAPGGTAQPAHIHEGSCADLSPQPKWPLSSVTDGKSTSTVPVSLAELRSGKYAINVHKSKEQIKTYVSCGDIK